MNETMADKILARVVLPGTTRLLERREGVTEVHIHYDGPLDLSRHMGRIDAHSG